MATERHSPKKQNPFAKNIDAILPIDMDEEGRPGYHLAGNLGYTTQLSNVVKAMYPPGILQIIANNLSAPFSEAEILHQLDAVHRVAVRLPYWHRLNPDFKSLASTNSLVECAMFQAEYMTISPIRTSAGTAHLRRYTKAASPIPQVGWKPEGSVRIMKLVREIQERFSNSKHKLQWSTDGCPYAGANGSMPIDWSWWRAWTWLAERWERMLNHCNRKISDTR